MPPHGASPPADSTPGGARPRSAHDVEDERLKALVHEAHLVGRDLLRQSSYPPPGAEKANDRHLTIKALDMALRRRCPGAGLLHHSDQGSTYASEDYQDVLERHGITCNMSRRGNCYDNAAMESWEQHAQE